MRDFYNILSEFSMYSTGGAPYKKHIVKRDGFRIESYKTEEGEFSSAVLEKSILFDDAMKKALQEAFSQNIISFLRKNKVRMQGLVLVVGVGNEAVAVDSLGSETLKSLDITEHMFKGGVIMPDKGRLASLKCGVGGVTGLDSFDVVKAVVERKKPACVIVVDTLSCKRASRLGKVVQVTDMGLLPGSGVGNPKTALNAETLGVPVISIGVPLVIYAGNIVSGYIADGTLDANANSLRRIGEDLSDMLVTVKDVDLVVGAFGKVLGASINMAVHR